MEVLNIAVCDDSIQVCSEVESIVLEYGKEKAIDIKTEVFYGAESLYKELEKGYEIDLLFLDILINDSSGIDIGETIRNEFQKDTMQIVYISSHREYAMELFKIRPLDFLIKPIAADEIRQKIDIVVKTSINCKNIYNFKSEGAEHKILISEILYFKRNGRTIELFTSEKTYNIYESLEKQFLKLRQNNFFYCHQSY